MMFAAQAPSSACRHLLPHGEKGGCAALHVKNRDGNGVSFSPAGRRCRQADEGVYAMDDNPVKRRLGKTDQARRLRRTETEEETRLWSDLRNRRLNGYKFARQVPLGIYIVDFLCRGRKLVVELDGFQHAESLADEARTLWLNTHGYTVLRFWNHEVTRERDAVLETILAALEGRMKEACNATRFYPALSSINEKTRERQS
ncbi:MAG: hypothetical protein DI589_07135 [Shinella sp.]|nr:MAG: hypothetical protein DI589_07135 [Shinella sp.]